jgi:hypothetical protein
VPEAEGVAGGAEAGRWGGGSKTADALGGHRESTRCDRRTKRRPAGHHKAAGRPSLGGAAVRRRGRRPEEGRRVTKSLCGADSVGGAVVTVGDDARRKVAAGRVGGGVLEV